MFSRILATIGFALLAALLTSLTVFAKGGFDFITIAAPELKEPVRIDDTSLTEGFFTFANFYEDKTEAPADPGTGYEITRHYEQGISNVIFDRLHYYPETGFVFYEGIENGDSEYDGEWYLANPEIKPTFESALARATRVGPPAGVEKEQPVVPAAALQADEAKSQARLVPSGPSSLTLLLILVAAGLAVLFAFASWRHQASAR